MKIKGSIHKKKQVVNLVIIAVLLTWLTFKLIAPARSEELSSKVYEEETSSSYAVQNARDSFSSLPVQAQYAISNILAREDSRFTTAASFSHSPIAKGIDARASLTGDPIMQKAKLTPSTGSSGDHFGYSVAMSDDQIVIGVGSSSVVYVFAKPVGGWAAMTETARLTPSALAPGFGNSVSISEDTIVVGAYEATIAGEYAAGAVYVFTKPLAGWTDMTETAKLWSLFPSSYNYFGYSVSISGDTIVVGEPFQNGAGRAYVFVKPVSGWMTGLPYQAKLVDEEVQYDYFGQAVSIDGNTLVVGAPNVEVDGKTDQGAAYVFVEPANGWAGSWVTPTAKLTASDGGVGDNFGKSVSISGDTVVVGAPYTTIASNTYQGAAYMFVRAPGNWTTTSSFAAKLTASDGLAGDYFGKSVSISGDTVVVGAPYATITSNLDQGAAYMFGKPGGGWVTTSTFTAKIMAQDGAANDRFGHAVSIKGSEIAVGAIWAKVGSVNYQGAAYVFGNMSSVYLPLVIQ